VRLDRALVEAGLARSRAQATQAVHEGRVQVNGRVVTRASAGVGASDRLELSDPDHYVSRAAHKLAGALATLGVVVPERVLDAGASTGGFTQVLLEAGARKVYAVDVGHGQLVSDLRADPRVVVRERLNLRDLTTDHLDGSPVGLVVGDVSFISLTLLLGPLFGVLAPAGEALLLVKPQFEVGRSGLDDHGVVRDAALRERAVAGVVEAAALRGYRLAGTARSALPGEAGNVEHFVHLVPSARAANEAS
jgi:23S rRNA (cytidine1920-2'-O)/16S rRNA (cytidine1409-2'-O)-methyltransferase